MTEEQPLSGGAAFWAARGVRIEPEVVDEETGEEFAPESSTQQYAEAAEQGPTDSNAETVGHEPGAADETEDPDEHDESDEAPQNAPLPQQGHGFEPASSGTAMPGFPQQRAATPAAINPPNNPATTAADAVPAQGAGQEPAWQLTGGELAIALPPLKTCLEAILMVVDEPVGVVTLAQVLERPKSEVADALAELAEEYTVLGRGFELREVGLGGEGGHTGWRIYTRAECAPVVERFVRDGQQAKLTQAALETLAVVAYRQPVSRSKVSAIRGVNCDGVMRTLLARGLIEEFGSDQETGAVLYQTTGYFLERMGLKSLEELPELAPLLPSAAEVDVDDLA